ncbi:DUF2383 domain-containing protein [Mariniflexile jejuense]|uniref:DUF2383 domain-containing protein n=1 Tax=Mariniflexile jejuense TaxID=1173582 RepID=A0ABW3JI87_9FLAO
MKSSEKILEKLNNLLIMNYGVEKVYLEALELATDDNLKAFFRERGFERNEFGRQLRAEIEKLNGKPKHFGNLSSGLNNIWLNLKNHLLLNNESELMDEIYKLKELTIDRYNMLLMEINLPLSVCKILMKQRDSVYSHMNAMKRQEEFVV